MATSFATSVGDCQRRAISGSCGRSPASRGPSRGQGRRLAVRCHSARRGRGRPHQARARGSCAVEPGGVAQLHSARPGSPRRSPRTPTMRAAPPWSTAIVTSRPMALAAGHMLPTRVAPTRSSRDPIAVLTDGVIRTSPPALTNRPVGKGSVPTGKPRNAAYGPGQPHSASHDSPPVHDETSSVPRRPRPGDERPRATRGRREGLPRRPRSGRIGNPSHTLLGHLWRSWARVLGRPTDATYRIL